MTGEPEFERTVRVHQNTAEVLLIFYPSLWIFSFTVSPLWGPGIGAVYLIGRFFFSAGYIKEASRRDLGFMLSFVPVMVLLVGGIIGVVQQLIKA